MSIANKNKRQAKIRELKQKARGLALKALLPISLSAGISGTAAAQNVQNNDKNHDVIEQGYNEKRAETDVPAIFGEKPIKLSKDNLWEMAQAARLDDRQVDAFIEDMVKLMKSPQGITDKNLKWILENNENYSKRQIEIMNNKALEFNVPVKAPAGEKIIEDGVREGEEGFAVKGTFRNTVKDNTRSGTAGSLSYSFEDGKLYIQNDGVVNLNGLMPSLVQTRDGAYRCGAITGSDRGRVIRQERAVLSRVVIEHEVHKDLSKRQENGEQLGKTEQTFMSKHLQDLKAHGLTIDKKGGLQRVDKMQQMQAQMQQGR